MSTKPSLALIPSAYKASKVYSVLPNDGTGDFDFSRATLATRINKDGLIETVGSNVPRLNYPMIDGVVSGCPSLLLEPARTNLIQYSEDFSNAYWNKVDASVSSNNSISPDGTLNSNLIQATSDVGLMVITNFLTETQQIISVFAKSGNYDKFKMGQASNEYYAEFDLTNGYVLNVNSNLSEASIDYYGNGWYRCSVAYASPLGLKTLGIVIEGNGNSVNFFGAQSEFGSYATSYIPTNGSSVTRDAETCNGAGDANTFNDSEGVLFAEVSALDESLLAISLSDGTTSNDVILFYYLNRIYLEINNSLTSISIFKSDIGSSNSNKIALKYKSGDVAMFLNGFEILTSTNAISLSGLDRINFDYGNGSYDFYGNTKQIQYFDSALNDSDLETLTSWVSFQDMAEGQLYTIE